MLLVLVESITEVSCFRRVAGVVLLVAISYCSASYQNVRRPYNDIYRPIYRPRPPFRRPVTPANPGTTPMITTISEQEDRKASEIGLKIPSRDCIISWNDFQKYVVDRDWIGIIGIDNDFSINPGIAFKFSVIWRRVNGTVIRRIGSLWEKDGANDCLFADGMFRRIDDSLAIFSSIGGNLFATSGRRDYFVCDRSRPVRYCIFHICYDSQNIRDGRCPNTETIVVVRDQRSTPINSAGIREGDIVLNGIPWTEIENDLRNCLGQMFVDSSDPQTFWAWENPACPVPGTEAFENGLSG